MRGHRELQTGFFGRYTSRFVIETGSGFSGAKTRMSQAYQSLPLPSGLDIPVSDG
jgi:hypothetical protein